MIQNPNSAPTFNLPAFNQPPRHATTDATTTLPVQIVKVVQPPAPPPHHGLYADKPPPALPLPFQLPTHLHYLLRTRNIILGTIHLVVAAHNTMKASPPPSASAFLQKHTHHADNDGEEADSSVSVGATDIVSNLIEGIVGGTATGDGNVSERSRSTSCWAT